MKPRTYREAGVDIRKEEETISALVSQLRHRRTGLGSPVGAPGFFTALLDFGEWVLTLNTDGVGTKLLVAEEVGRWDTVGIDCVAMNVNDTICAGAEPIALVDYFAVERYDEEVARQVGIGLNRGAELANITVVGGELATIPEIVKGYDLVGTCLGFAPRDRVIDGRDVSPEDVIVGLPSSGLHSNGFTMVRKLLKAENVSYDERVPGSSETYGDALLRPTEIYVRDVLQVLRECRVTGMAHITGGGLLNVARIRGDLRFEITDPLRPQPIFHAIQDMSGIDMAEMYTTFNMGLGFVLVMPEDEAGRALEVLRPKRDAKVIGVVREGRGVEVPSLDLAL
jgi:phosphoribosylformylglycinamidine cyclo-ligase